MKDFVTPALPVGLRTQAMVLILTGRPLKPLLEKLEASEIQQVRNFLEAQVLHLSRLSDKNPLSLREIKAQYEPIPDYYQRQQCNQTLEACWNETCLEANPICFSHKLQGQIAILQDWVNKYLFKPETQEYDPTQAVVENKRILVIDDDPYQIKLIKYKLVKDGFQVDAARNGIEALELVQQNRYDLIVCDIMMPGMDGFLFLRNLKNIPEASHIPVIFLTAVSDEQSIVKGLELGADDYITKPFSPVELTMRIKKHLQGKV
ncbi:MAG: response regulator [Calditrichaeota bacterium]|nr:MAG: response regulator [Calditrichota bacterium]